MTWRNSYTMAILLLVTASLLWFEVERDTPRFVNVVSQSGFYLDIPYDWQGLYRSVDNVGGRVWSMYFSWGSTPEQLLFAVHRVPEAEWNLVESRTTVRKMDSVGGEVYYAEWLAKNPLSGQAGDLYQAMSRGVPKVLESFGLAPSALE